MERALRPAIFLDRDGVIIKDVPDIRTEVDIELFDFSARAIRTLNDLGFLVIVITNQPQIAKGMLTEGMVREMNNKITAELKAHGAKIDGVYYCPHHPDKGFPGERPEYKIDCECRKPKTGMIDKAAEEHGIDLSESFIVGDTWRDVQTGVNAAIKHPGFRSVLVGSGSTETDSRFPAKPDFAVGNLLDAAMLIKEIVARDKRASKAGRINVLIVAGGEGTRLRPMTYDIPKALVPIDGKPIIVHQIEALLGSKQDLKGIVVCTGYKHEMIEEALGDGSGLGVRIQYANENEPLGTGGAIKNAERFVDGTSLVLYGDIFFEIDLKRLLGFHREKDAIATLVLHESSHPYDSDLVEVDERGMVTAFIGKPEKGKPLPSRLANSAVYMLEPEAFGFMPSGKHSFEDDVLRRLIETKRVYGYVTDEYIKDMGTFDRLNEVKKSQARAKADGRVGWNQEHSKP